MSNAWRDGGLRGREKELAVLNAFLHGVLESRGAGSGYVQPAGSLSLNSPGENSIRCPFPIRSYTLRP